MHQKKLLYSFKSVDEIREARKRICSVSCFRLISLAAQSIHAVSSDRVFGFRMGEFDVEELFKQADELMYLDKKARKEKGETSHLRSES